MGLLCYKVYPHLRGAAVCFMSAGKVIGGVSPLARGSHPKSVPHEAEHRCIPTCAGQPSRERFFFSENAVYPHLRGAACARPSQASRHIGVSPLARGSHSEIMNTDIRLWCIPTCAGQPSSARTRHSSRRVYPHLRGAAAISAKKMLKKTGVSPLARGSPTEQHEALKKLGCIPTCAGQPVAV